MEKPRLIPVLLIPVFLLITLSACSNSEEQATPTRSATPTPSSTFTPAPTSTPYVTPTPTPTPTPTLAPLPTPDTLGILPTAAEMCEMAFSSQVIPNSADHPIVTLFKSEFEEGAEWTFLDVPHQALSTSSISTLVCVKESRIREGAYSDGTGAYRQTWTIRLVGWPDGQVYEETVMRGTAPPPSKSGSGDAYGLEPRLEFLRWLALRFEEPIFFVAGNLQDLAVSPDGEYLAAASGGFLTVWSISTSRQIPEIGEEYDHIYLSVAFSPDSLSLASGHRDSSISLWNVLTGERFLSLSGHSDDVSSLTFSPDGQTLASGSQDSSVKLWSVERGEEIMTLSGHQASVNSVAFSADGQILASAGWDDTVRLWSVDTGQELFVVQGPSNFARTMAFSPDGQHLATGGSDYLVRLWNVNDGVEVHTMSGHVGYVNSVVFSPDGLTIASGSGDNSVRLWDVESGQQISVLRGHISAVTDLVFLPDGQTLVSGSMDETVRLWRTRIDE